MPGGLFQLIAVGNQDAYLTQDPEITFFKMQHKRHSRFAIESMENTFTGSVGFGNKVTCLVSHNADLLWKMYLQVDVSGMTGSGSNHVAWVKNLGFSMIDKIEIDIGGQIIDTQYGQFMNIMKELSTPLGHIDTLNNMIGNVPELNDLTNPSTTSTPATRLRIPLGFWFCQHISNAIPLVAIQRQDVKVNVYFNPVSSLYVGTPVSVPTIQACSLWADYIYLNNEERDKFINSNLEYLIDQCQQQQESVTSSSFRSRLTFNHPCQDLLWVVQPNANITANDVTNFTNSGSHTVVDAELQLNGQPRFTRREGAYFNQIQPWQHYLQGPSVGIYAYSFALRPDDAIPTGSCNFSKMDNAVLSLNLSTTDAKLTVYARNKNIFKFKKGLAGILYAS
jgi:hypothetical protein